MPKNPVLLPNPQTDELLNLLALDHVITVPCPGSAPYKEGVSILGGGGGAGGGEGEGGEGAGDPFVIDVDPNEIQLD